MKIIDQSWSFEQKPQDLLKVLEKAARTCYKSEDKIADGTAETLLKALIRSGHHSVLEFADITLRIITSRSVTHELVRHRICNFAQESQRYVKYDGEIEFIRPVWCSDVVLGVFNENYDFDIVEEYSENLFCASLWDSERAYQVLLEKGWRPEQAREVLPNSTKTEILVKANIREWRHILNLRCSMKAHPQIRSLMRSILREFHQEWPVLFDDLAETYSVRQLNCPRI